MILPHTLNNRKLEKLSKLEKHEKLNKQKTINSGKQILAKRVGYSKASRTPCPLSLACLFSFFSFFSLFSLLCFLFSRGWGTKKN